MEFKTSKAGADYLSIQWRLVESNRVVFDILNLFHPTEQVRNIALQTVKKMLQASGFEGDLNFSTKEALCVALAEVRCDIFLKIDEQEGYAPKNVVKGFSPTKEQAPVVDASSIPF